jgi:starvation-inducible DNA-binding protein
MKNHQTIEHLEKILANSYMLFLKTHNYHWNVVGTNFKSLHELFEEQYKDLFGAIDEIAERIRALGSKVEASFENFQKLSKFKSANKDLEAKMMIRELISDNEILVKDLKIAVKVSEAEDDDASADLLIKRIQIHEKAIWILSSMQ